MKKTIFFTVQKNDTGQYVLPQELAEPEMDGFD